MGISSYSWNIPSQLHEVVCVCRAPPRTWRFSNICHIRVDAHLCGCNVWRIKSWLTASARLSGFAHWLQTDTHLIGIDSFCSLLRTRNVTPPFGLDPDLWPWPSSKVTVMSKHNFGSWPWPTTLTYNPILLWVNVEPNAKNQANPRNKIAFTCVLKVVDFTELY